MHWMPLVLLLMAVSANAAETRFDGRFEQGGLVIGRTDPGTAVSLDGRPVRVAGDGTFLLAFGRDAAATSRLTVADETRVIDIAPRDWPEQRIDGLPERQVTPPKLDWDRIRHEGALIAAARRTDSEPPLFASGFVWPVVGTVSGVFGSRRVLNGKPRSPHKGVDIAAPLGTPVGACADGRVALVHEDMFYTGKTVMLDHGHGLSSIYVHLNSIFVAEGQDLIQGQVLGTVGRTGRATGPHLHWGVSLFATHVDPARLVGPMPKTRP